MACCWPLQMPPTQKAVLISLADNANDSGYCWPSIATICERTCFGKTAVIDAIRWLEDHNALSAGRVNGRHTTYTVTPDRFNQSVSRTSPADAPVRQADRTGTAGGQDRSVSRTAPVRQADTNRKEPSLTVKSNQQIQVDLPDWLPASAWTDWVQHRRDIKKPLSGRAAELTIAKLAKLRLKGHDPTELIENAIESGWQGIYAPRTETRNANLQSSSKLSAVERVEQAIRDRRENNPDDDQDAALARIGYG